jgi:hypothetical protein
MEHEGFQGGSDFSGQEARGPGDPSPGGKKEFESKLDEVADRVSRTVSEGVKRLEEAASHIEQRPEISEGRVKKFFTSPMGGLVVTMIGVLWFFNAVGLFRSWIVALIVTGIGIYMIYRFRSDEPTP